MTSQPAQAGHHPGYWPWGDEPRPVEDTVPIGYRPPGGRRTGRSRTSVAFEVLVAAVVWAAVAAVMGWRVLRQLGTVVPGEGPAPFTQLWSLAWSGHVLRTDPAGVVRANGLARNTFTGDSLLGFGPLTWFTHDQRGLLTLFGLLVVLLPAVSALGAYALARQLGAHPIGAAVAGAAFGWAPWHATHLSHLGALATGPAVVALALLARGHGWVLSGRRERDPVLRPLWAISGWLVAAGQLTIGWVVGLPFATLLTVVAVLTVLTLPVSGLRRRRDGGFRRPRAGWLVFADLLGGLLFAATAYVMAQPYLDRPRVDVARFSPTPLGLVTPPAVDGSWSRLWSAVMHDGLPGAGDEVRWLPGVLVLALAVLGLVLSRWRWWWRALLLIGAAGCAGLALGTRLPLTYRGETPFEWLQHVPGWEAYPTPGNLVVWGTLAVALLAAGAVSRMTVSRMTVSHMTGRTVVLTVLLAALPVVVLLEGWVRTPVMPVPATPAALARASGPTVVLPSTAADDARARFWSIDPGLPAGPFLSVVNGRNGAVPGGLAMLRQQVRTFPDAASVAYLRSAGVRSVVVVGPAPAPTPGTLPGLGRTDLGDSVLYTL